MKKKFQHGQYAPEYAVVAGLLALVFVVDNSIKDANEDYKGILEIALTALSSLWSGFGFVVSLPLN